MEDSVLKSKNSMDILGGKKLSKRGKDSGVEVEDDLDFEDF